MTTTTTADQVSGRERYSISYRSVIDREALDDESESPNGSTLWETIRGYILTTNFRYTSFPTPIADFELDMRDLWHTFIQAARITNADDPAQDRLVSQLLYAHSMGTLRRTATSGNSEEVVTSDGSRIWTDLPYLVQDMREAWGKSMELSPTHRHNLAAFTARLTALGVRGSDLSVCALWLLRAALETPRRLTRGGDVSVAELLPACVAWFQYCNHKLLTLAVNNHVFAEIDPHFSEPGELAQNAGVSHLGFSVSRWLFWRQRFKELSRDGDEQMAKDGRRGFYCMINTGREMGYEIAGESKYRAKVNKALVDEMKRSGKNNASSDDIVIDLDWTE
jgi:hypothetical protein